MLVLWAVLGLLHDLSRHRCVVVGLTLLQEHHEGLLDLYFIAKLLVRTLLFV